MEPHIQYAKTSDGVSIAYYQIGEGPALVFMPTIPVTHLEFEWQMPIFRLTYDPLIRSNTLIRYDSRGFGLSDRGVTDFSLDAMVRDLEAVVDHLGLGKFQLLATGWEGSVAIAYAFRHAERVSHLVLWHASARGSDVAEAFNDLAALAEKDWELASEAWLRTAFGWEGSDPPRQLAALMRECANPDTLALYVQQVRQRDVRDLLPRLTVPTLVAHRRQYRYTPLEASRRIAATIPDARLLLLEGSSYEIGQDGLAAILEFLSEGEEAAAADAMPAEPGAFRTVLFTDVEGSTALTERLGDDRAREVLREHERMVREALKAHGGSEVKTMGDGFMASFSSATKALECAIAMQRAFAEHNESVEEPIFVKVGLNAGEPIAEEDPDGRSDLFGTAVNLAARIAAKAEGGQILTSDTVRGLVAGKRFLFSDHGETAMRGFEDAVKLYELSWRES
jgi:class 3 adenylate cyclase